MGGPVQASSLRALLPNPADRLTEMLPSYSACRAHILNATASIPRVGQHMAVNKCPGRAMFNEEPQGLAGPALPEAEARRRRSHPSRPLKDLNCNYN